MTTEQGAKLGREAAFARRLERACDESPYCPPLYKGRLTWIRDELSKRLERTITVQTVARWMNGEAKPRHDKNIQLAGLLGVDSTWLFLGIEPDLSPRERKVRNAMADGAVNLVAGLIQMDGGHPAFPEEKDVRAQREHIDLYAVIRGANYAIHVALGEQAKGEWAFKVPAEHEHIIILGLVREGFSFRVVEITTEMIEQRGAPTGERTITVSLDDGVIETAKLESFANRL